MMLRSRVPSLDGLRGLAVVAVLGYHAAPATFSGGFLGVDVFFVLSGYLLTSWLLREQRRSGVVDVHTYAVRRVRRIAPALLVLLATLAVVAPVLAPAALDGLQRDLIWSAVGLTNWHLIADGSSYFSRFGGPSLVRHLWSVAIEIQFYVACPFLVGWLARRRRGVAIAALVLGIGASAARMALLAGGADSSRAYFGTDTRASALLVGVLVAMLTEPSTRYRRLRQHPTLAAAPAWARRTAVASLVLLAAGVAAIDDRTPFLYRGGFLLAEAATAIVIYAALHHGSIARLLGRRSLRWLGERSYGIYLWHWPIVVMLRPAGAHERPVLTIVVVSVAGALILGDLSYRLVERPLLRGRRVLGAVPRRGMAHATALVAGIAVVGMLAIVRAPGTSSLASSLSAGQRVLAQTGAAAAEAASATTTADPTTDPAPAPAPPDTAVAPAPTPPPTPSPAAAPARVAMIGDSVMISAASALRARLAPDTVIDARQGRQFPDALSVARGMRAKGELGGVVVLALGNNGPVTARDVDRVMTELGDVKRVLIVTTRVGREWQDEVNDVLRTAATQYPVATLVDWWTASADHPEWFQRDGTHFRTSEGPGATAYADLIATALNP